MKEIIDQSIPYGNNKVLPTTSELLNNLNIDDVPIFIKNKLEVWNLLVDTNPILSEEEKSKVKENFHSFELQVNNNKMLYDKYRGSEKLFFIKILEKLSEKELLDQNKSFANINDIKINLIGGDFVIEISDDNMDDFFGESFNGVTTPEIKIDGISIYPIVVRKSSEQKNKLIAHELQHFYNQFLIRHSDEIEKVVLNYLADETIAQSIGGSWGQEAENWKLFLVDCISSGVNGNPHSSYSFGNRFNGTIDGKIILNGQILTYLDDVDIARELRDAGIKNYADILAITPIWRRNELKNYYLNKQKPHDPNTTTS